MRKDNALRALFCPRLSMDGGEGLSTQSTPVFEQWSSSVLVWKNKN